MSTSTDTITSTTLLVGTWHAHIDNA